MTTVDKSSVSGATDVRVGSGSGVSGVDRREAVGWADVVPRLIDHEDAFSPTRVDATWVQLFAKAGMPQLNEGERKAFKLATYAYLCVNGTSREGNYAGVVVLSTGASYPAANIPAVVGKQSIRRFMRGAQSESYAALKTSRVMEKDPRFVAKLAELGVPAECAFVAADWMAGCAEFTPEESRYHAMLVNHNLMRSSRARGGKSLEAVEGGRRSEIIDAQDVDHAGVGSQGYSFS